MLYELLNCEKGDSVSVEVFDDVGVEHPDGSRDAIQLKSALSNRNPVSNKAIDLWKTMYNWMLSAETGELDPENTKYILFINVNKKGTIVDKFHSVKSTEEAIDAWNKTKEIFYDEQGKLKEIGDLNIRSVLRIIQLQLGMSLTNLEFQRILLILFM